MSNDKIKAKLGLYRALYNAVGKVESFYNYECPACDLEQDEECTCREGLQEFTQAQDTMFLIYKTLRDNDLPDPEEKGE